MRRRLNRLLNTHHICSIREANQVWVRQGLGRGMGDKDHKLLFHEGQVRDIVQENRPQVCDWHRPARSGWSHDSSVDSS